jgi:AcrR family transcriptional regulator
MKKPPASRKARGRPRSFDRDAALAAAMEVFWRRGYEGASLAELTEAMGINPPSLYAAFGDKERLFLEALERYLAARGDACPYGDEPTARGAIERLLTYLAEDLTATGHPRGCMLMLAAATAGSGCPAIQATLARHRAEARTRLRDRIQQGIDAGDVRADVDAGALADFYSTVIAGMATQAREGASRRSLMAAASHAMSAFPERRAQRPVAA